MKALFLAVALTFLTGACGSGSAGPAGPGTGGGSGMVLPPADEVRVLEEDPMTGPGIPQWSWRWCASG